METLFHGHAHGTPEMTRVAGDMGRRHGGQVGIGLATLGFGKAGQVAAAVGYRLCRRGSACACASHEAKAVGTRTAALFARPPILQHGGGAACA